MSWRETLRSWLLPEQSLTKRERGRVIAACEGVLARLAEAPIEEKGVRLLPLLEHRLMGHNLNLSSLILSEVSNPPLRRMLFRLLYRLRQSLRHRGDTRHYASYDVALTRTKPKSVPRLQPWALITCCDPSYLRTLEGVMRELDRRRKRFVLLLPRKARSWSTAKGLSFRHGTIIYVEDVVTAGVLKALRSPQPPLDPLFRECSVRGRSLLPQLRPALPTIQQVYLPHAAAYVTLAHELFDRWKPRVLIGAKLRRAYDKAFFAVAKQSAIPSLGVQPIHLTEDLTAFYDQGDFTLPDHFVLWDDEQLQLITQRPRVESDLHIIGNPQWDAMLATEPGQGAAALGRERRGYGVIATQPGWSLTDVRLASRSLCDAGLTPILKLHPRDQRATYAPLGEHIFDESFPGYALLRDAAVLITSHSNIAYESFLLGTPSYFLNTDSYVSPAMNEAYNRYKRLGIPRCRTRGELARELKKLKPRKPLFTKPVAPRIVDLAERIAR